MYGEVRAMGNSIPVTEIISQRYSCRTYLKKPISGTDREELERYLAAMREGPFGGAARFRLMAASEEDLNSLRDLGTYGMIKNAPGFIAGAVKKTGKNLEDYGFLLERIVLFATGLGLGTCWLGGTFNRSGFARSMSLADDEVLPAVLALGYAADRPSVRDSLIRFTAGSKKRNHWGSLFFHGGFDTPLADETAGVYREPLEMARLAPSASNKQPWRVVRGGGDEGFHFYLQRTKGYDRGIRLVGGQDLQRVDMGICMSHFEASAREAGLTGKWTMADPRIGMPGEGCEYVATWIAE
jgi:nitroreductase